MDRLLESVADTGLLVQLMIVYDRQTLYHLLDKI